jgi:hypothetical protein
VTRKKLTGDAKAARRLALWRKRERAFTRLANANAAFNAAEDALTAFDSGEAVSRKTLTGDAKTARRLALWRKRERAFIRLINANNAFNAAEAALDAFDSENP